MSVRGASVVVLAVAVLSGCAHRQFERIPSAEDREAIAELYPLAVGNRWTYDTRFFGQQGSTVVEIVREDRGNFLHHSTPADPREPDRGLRVDAFGLRDDKRYLLRDPLEPGKTWTNVVSVSAVEHYTVLDVGSACSVPAGQFTGCVKVEGRTKIDQKATLVNELTFAPKVGLVQISLFLDVNGKRIPQHELKLKAFKLAPAPTSPPPAG